MKTRISENLKEYFYWMRVIVIGIVLGISLQFVRAWTEPTLPAPGGNVSGPLNVSAIGQSKTGGLILNTGGAVNGLIVAAGNVGIGTTTPAQKLSVAGVIESTSGGIKFPDGTIQTTACSGSAPVSTGSQTFTTSGTWTHPAGVSSVYVTICGAGGGGAGGHNGGGGGGAGGTCLLRRLYSVSSDVSVIIGNGGLGGAKGTNMGALGGVSSFGSLTASGGGGGSGIYGGSGGTGGGGGAGSGNAAGGKGGTDGGNGVSTKYGLGGSGVGVSGSGGYGGAGGTFCCFSQNGGGGGGGGGYQGSSIGGAGGSVTSTVVYVPGSNGTGYASGGGGGAGGVNVSGAKGGNGTSGIVIVEW